MHPNMQLRRLLLDGIKIIKPYERELRKSHTYLGKFEDEAIANEVALMKLWIKSARIVALKLKRSAPGKPAEHTK